MIAIDALLCTLSALGTAACGLALFACWQWRRAHKALSRRVARIGFLEEAHDHWFRRAKLLETEKAGEAELRTERARHARRCQVEQQRAARAAA